MIARNDDGTFAAFTETGLYPIFHICDDGGDLCAKCANEHGHTDKPNDGWRVVASDINWEDQTLQCDHCGELIEPACGFE